MASALVVEDDRTNDVPPSWLRRKPGEPAAGPRHPRTFRGVGAGPEPTR
ncbi:MULTISPECIES: winged helix-turn-helix domain-containing protein [unclassified Streptomyces]|nr:hypothetical protein [Streptomyces sp. SID4936]